MPEQSLLVQRAAGVEPGSTLPSLWPTVPAVTGVSVAASEGPSTAAAASPSAGTGGWRLAAGE